MEGVPRVSMLSFTMRKSAENPNFRSKLKAFIRDAYTEDGESYSNEINDLESLRAGAIHVSKDFSGCSTLKKYFCQLNFLKSRFPLQEGGLCAISFSWYDVFSETVHGWSDVDFEMSAILYNIGALHSELGATDNRQSADGMKNACTHFQCAAWAFQHLRHNYPKFFTPDVSPDTLSIMTNVCLAQAQECILEKSLIDNRKSTITAKVALQIVEYYQLALKTSDQLLKDSGQYSDKVVKAVKKWRKLIELKTHYYDCISFLYRGMQAEDENKWGDRVAFYKAALEKLNEAVKSAKALEKTDNIHDTLQFTFDVVQGKVAVSEKENEFIYHEKVPELSAVGSDVKGVSLVKGIPFKFDDPQIAGADIFGRLVPMEAHEASSLYSEEKAKLLRNYSSKIEAKNETLDKLIIALQLDQLDLHTTSTKVPPELVDCCAALSVNKDAVKKLSEHMSKLSGMFHDVEGNLGEIEQMLEEDGKKSKEIQEILGNRPLSNVTSELAKEVDRYKSAHSVAAETNQTLHEALSKHVGNLNILLKPFDEVMKFIPSLEEDADMDSEAINQMKRLAGKVDEMRKQRIMLEQQLRDSIHSDDITKQLVIKKGQDLDQVFQEELLKHDKITQVLDQNLLAQENIIRALTEANANYAETRKKTVQVLKRRDKVIEDLLSSYEAYDELLVKVNKGIDFYTKLDTNVQKLLQRTRAVCKVQEEERETAMKALIQKGKHMNTNPLNFNMGAYIPPSNNSPHQMPGDLSSPQNYSMPPIPSGGGHLKLKDVLAMKKSGAMPQKQTAPTTPAMVNPNNGASFPATYSSPSQVPNPNNMMSYSDPTHPTGYPTSPQQPPPQQNSNNMPSYSDPARYASNPAPAPNNMMAYDPSKYPSSNPQQSNVNPNNIPTNYSDPSRYPSNPTPPAMNPNNMMPSYNDPRTSYSSNPAPANQNNPMTSYADPTRYSSGNPAHVNPVPPPAAHANPNVAPYTDPAMRYPSNPAAHVNPTWYMNPASSSIPAPAPVNHQSATSYADSTRTSIPNPPANHPNNVASYSDPSSSARPYTSGTPSTPTTDTPRPPNVEYNVNEGFLAKYVKQHLGNTVPSSSSGSNITSGSAGGGSYLMGNYGATAPSQQSGSQASATGTWYQQGQQQPQVSNNGYNNSQSSPYPPQQNQLAYPQQQQQYTPQGGPNPHQQQYTPQGGQNQQQYWQQGYNSQQQQQYPNSQQTPNTAPSSGYQQPSHASNSNGYNNSQPSFQQNPQNQGVYSQQQYPQQGQNNQGQWQQQGYNNSQPQQNQQYATKGPQQSHNIDLLSGIDLNAPPAEVAEPLRPTVAHTTT